MKLKVDKWLDYWRVGPYPYNILKNTWQEAMDYALEEAARMSRQPLVSDGINTLKNVSYSQAEAMRSR